MEPAIRVVAMLILVAATRVDSSPTPPTCLFVNNCYSWSLQDYVCPPMPSPLWIKPVPGNYGGLPFLSLSDYTCGRLIARIIDIDLPTAAILMPPKPNTTTTTTTTCPPTHPTPIVLFLDTIGTEEGRDFHLLRYEQATGTWSHKRGIAPVSDRDATGAVITNPLTANLNFRALVGGHDYDTFCGQICLSLNVSDVARAARLKWPYTKP